MVSLRENWCGNPYGINGYCYLSLIFLVFLTLVHQTDPGIIFLMLGSSSYMFTDLAVDALELLEKSWSYTYQFFFCHITLCVSLAFVSTCCYNCLGWLCNSEKLYIMVWQFILFFNIIYNRPIIILWYCVPFSLFYYYFFYFTLTIRLSDT